ncbi:Uncharacterized conserved protein PhnB, glyoxalase superfamily [Rhodococcus maanshanensis]|uniref:Uncharacterized conserved protein PhnB, glyoxalase superfamily n=2 Tax=Rhodococcus maanshanensis TaxID=183556 RepID=A0A1H7HI83_9NOCA|nr:Uncharacterized conserved protein PhnB, glyoxalase superfamily [Rhodococcus maanshanensis]
MLLADQSIEYSRHGPSLSGGADATGRVSETFKTVQAAGNYRRGMTPQLSMIGLAVADLSRSFDIYRRLGFDLPADPGQEKHHEITLAGGLRVAWDTLEVIRSFSPEFTQGTGGPSMAFDCGTPEAVDAKFSELTEAGCAAESKPWDAFWGQRYAVVRDPDGHGIELFSALPG